MPQLGFTEVDGVRAVWADLPGPLRAGLVVRVGAADETLPTSGVSHLLEHLALFGAGRPGDHSNGFVDQTVSMYHCTGDAGTVRDFLRDVTRGLSDPPVERLAVERGVLKAEAARGSRTPEDDLLVWRYGAQGYGLAGQDQLGVGTLTAKAVRAWSARYATRQNSVLWFSQPPPAGLAVTLPDGEHRPPPDPRPSILPVLPAYFEAADRSGVALHSVLERSFANGVLEQVLQARLVDLLRVKHAYAYAPQVDYRPLTESAGRLVVVSDAVEGRSGEVMDMLCSTLTGLGDQPPTEDELAECERRRRTAWDAPGASLGLVTSAAWGMAMHAQVYSADEVDAATAAVTPEEVSAVAREALARALLCAPQGKEPVRHVWSAAPGSTHDAVIGRTLRRAWKDQPGELVVGRTGVTRRQGEVSVTVPVEHVAAVQRWADGLRVLVADDGARVVVEPNLWKDGAGAVATIDAIFPADVVVDMGTRPKDDIPQGPRSRLQRIEDHLTFRGLSTVGWVVLVAGVGLGISLVVTGRPEGVAPLMIALAVTVRTLFMKR